MTETSKSDIRKIYRTAIGEGGLPPTIKITIGDQKIEYERVSWKVGDLDCGMRYGDNPHQHAALYRPKDFGGLFFGDIEWSKMGKQGPSATNLEDGYRGLKICSYFDKPAVAVMKHVNPSGVAIGINNKTFAQVFEDAYNGDSRAAFGSVICSNVPITEDVVQILTNIYDGKYNDGYKSFIECLYAPSFDAKVLEFLNQKKEVRIAQVPDISRIKTVPFPYEIKIMGDTIQIQDRYETNIKSVEDLKQKQVVTKRQPTESEWEQMIYSWIVCANKRSNGVVIWKDNAVEAVGCGQQDRIGAIEVAISRAERMKHDLKDSVLASDGFMLWDNVDPLGPRGISAIVQPGGSLSDEKVIKVADDYNMTMVLTGERCFRHI